MFLVGGSTVFGVGVSDEETISSHLQTMLDRNCDRYQIINAGVIGYYSTQELIQIHRNLVRHNPVMIVALTGRNDAFYSLHPTYRYDSVPYHGLMREKLGALDPYYQGETTSLTPLHLERLIRGMLKALPFDWLREWRLGGLEIAPEGIEIFVRNQESIQALLSGLGIEYHLFLQPTVAFPQRKRTQGRIELPPGLLFTSPEQGLSSARKQSSGEIGSPLVPWICTFTGGGRAVHRRCSLVASWIETSGPEYLRKDLFETSRLPTTLDNEVYSWFHCLIRV